MALKDIDHRQHQLTKYEQSERERQRQRDRQRERETERDINTEMPTTMLLLCKHIYIFFYGDTGRETENN